MFDLVFLKKTWVHTLTQLTQTQLVTQKDQLQLSSFWHLQVHFQQSDIMYI